MIPVKNAPRRVAREPGQKLAKLIEQHERNEARLRRAMRAWDKSLLALRRAERRLDKLVLAPEQDASPDDFNDSLGDPQSDGFGQ
jgi:hypothetical protein